MHKQKCHKLSLIKNKKRINYVNDCEFNFLISACLQALQRLRFRANLRHAKDIIGNSILK